MAAPNMNGRLHLTGVHQKPPHSLKYEGHTRGQGGGSTPPSPICADMSSILYFFLRAP